MVYGPGMAAGFQSYMNRPAAAAPWADYGDMEAQQVQMDLAQRRQAALNQVGGALGKAGRYAWQNRPAPARAYTSSFTPGQMPGDIGAGFGPAPSPARMPPVRGMVGAGAPKPPGLTLQQAVGKVAGPAALAYNTYESFKSGNELADYARQLQQLHPDDQRAGMKDLEDTATKEAIARFRSGAATGAMVGGPVGAVAGGAAGAIGAMRGGAKGVGANRMLASVGKEMAKQQAASSLGAAAAPQAGTYYAMAEGLKKLKDLL